MYGRAAAGDDHDVGQRRLPARNDRDDVLGLGILQAPKDCAGKRVLLLRGRADDGLAASRRGSSDVKVSVAVLSGRSGEESIKDDLSMPSFKTRPATPLLREGGLNAECGRGEGERGRARNRKAGAGARANRAAINSGRRQRDSAAPAGLASARSVDPGRSTTRMGTRAAMSRPALPAVKLAEIVGAHDPDEMDPRGAPLQPEDRLVGVARADLGLEAGDGNARICGSAGAPPRCAPAFRRARTGDLSGLPGVDEPPEVIEARRCSASCEMSRWPSCGGLNEPPSGRSFARPRTAAGERSSSRLLGEQPRLPVGGQRVDDLVEPFALHQPGRANRASG